LREPELLPKAKPARMPPAAGIPHRDHAAAPIRPNGARLALADPPDLPVRGSLPKRLT
jgi:hypothetical protein